MRATRRQDTAAEMGLRRELHARGLRYRLHVRLPFLRRRIIDIAFPKQRIAVLVNGCFWHGCPQHATWPSANAAWWREKIEANLRRDADTDSQLAAHGWTVIRVWEHEVPREAADEIAMLVRQLQA